MNFPHVTLAETAIEDAGSTMAEVPGGTKIEQIVQRPKQSSINKTTGLQTRRIEHDCMTDAYGYYSKAMKTP